MADIDPDSLSALIKRYAQTYRGIRPHNLNAYLTDHLKWDRYKVHRRLNNTVPWKDSELRDVAAVFGVSVAELTARSAVKQASVPTQAPTPAPALATPAAPAPAATVWETVVMTPEYALQVTPVVMEVACVTAV